MLVDAVILAGGRSSRLGTDKAALMVGARTLLGHAVQAAGCARRRVIVGDAGRTPLPPGALVVREEPRFSGPAAALAAGLAALGTGAEAILVLACDIPRAAAVVPMLQARLERSPDADGAIALDEGRVQYLAALYRAAALAAAVAARPGLAGLSMRQLVEPLRLDPVTVPAGTTADIDTWEDAARFGVPAPGERGT